MPQRPGRIDVNHIPERARPENNCDTRRREDDERVRDRKTDDDAAR